ncbi:sensitivity to high expression protein she9 [Extremus antarcticus]|uniref:Sensitive to high expression protein 9, mitochondrial n=1 Tax=Extremus antarcticus TaxID=702011 RepID=A0AAJ0D9Q3_9PEZI|nr:sensitivity to high expression protein she9 [Extremus antarcticus]
MDVLRLPVRDERPPRITGAVGLRHFTTTRILRDEAQKQARDIPTSTQPTITPSNETPTTTAEIDPTTTSHEQALPSSTERRRSDFSKRLTRIADSILARASIAGQHINVYTGTDYSGIEALRSRIAAQEESVRTKILIADSARTVHQEAHLKQGADQKEIVALLERKSSWSPADLERYMSLVRSEHTNEQAVQHARNGLADADRNLESTRSLLERLERKQYHEEQIWSDTIRRNSTWVTFGLMGLNIILLLAQIAIFEPYRRRKIVREVERVVDEKSGFKGAPVVAEEVVKQVDEVVEPVPAAIEAMEEADTPLDPSLEQSVSRAVMAPHDVGEVPLAAGEVLPQEAAEVSDISTKALPTAFPTDAPTSQRRPETWSAAWDSYVESFQDLFSERVVQLKKVDVTTTALQGAATGVAAMGLLFVFFRPR